MEVNTLEYLWIRNFVGLHVKLFVFAVSLNGNGNVSEAEELVAFPGLNAPIPPNADPSVWFGQSTEVGMAAHPNSSQSVTTNELILCVPAVAISVSCPVSMLQRKAGASQRQSSTVYLTEKLCHVHAAAHRRYDP